MVSSKPVNSSLHSDISESVFLLVRPLQPLSAIPQIGSSLPPKIFALHL